MTGGAGGGRRGATTATTADGEMSPMTITEPLIMPATQTLQEYVAASGKHIRTVKQWLADDLLPGATQDPVTGRWAIPVGAVRTAPTQQTLTRKPEQAVEQVPAAPAGPNWDLFPTMLTLQQAEQLLGVGWRTIAAHGDYFGVVELDRKRVPLATVKRLRGMIP